MPNYVPLLRLLAGPTSNRSDPGRRKHVGQALKQLPEDRSLRRQYANLQLQARQPARALDTLKAVIDSGKVDADTLLIYGRAQMAQATFAAADGAFAQAAKLRPEDPRLQAALALSTWCATAVQQRPRPTRQPSCANWPPKTPAALRHAARQRPAAPARSARRVGRHRQASGQDAQQPRTFKSCAAACNWRKKTSSRRALGEAASKADPKYLPAVLGLARARSARWPRRGTRATEAFVGQQSPAMARLALAEMLFQSKADAERITTVLTEGVRLEPNEPALRVALIDHRLMLNDTAGAAQAAQEAAAALPNPELLERLPAPSWRAMTRARHSSPTPSSRRWFRTRPPGYLSAWRRSASWARHPWCRTRDQARAGRRTQLRHRAAAVHPDCRPSGPPRPSPGPDAPAPEGPPQRRLCLHR